MKYIEILFYLQNVKMLQVQRKGAETALTTCAVEMGASLPTVLPYLWETIHTTLQQKVPDPGCFKIFNPMLLLKVIFMLQVRYYRKRY